jgi:hypothetical protein
MGGGPPERRDRGSDGKERRARRAPPPGGGPRRAGDAVRRRPGLRCRVGGAFSRGASVKRWDTRRPAARDGLTHEVVGEARIGRHARSGARGRARQAPPARRISYDEVARRARAISSGRCQVIANNHQWAYAIRRGSNAPTRAAGTVGFRNKRTCQGDGGANGRARAAGTRPPMSRPREPFLFASRGAHGAANRQGARPFVALGSRGAPGRGPSASAAPHPYARPAPKVGRRPRGWRPRARRQARCAFVGNAVRLQTNGRGARRR